MNRHEVFYHFYILFSISQTNMAKNNISLLFLLLYVQIIEESGDLRWMHPSDDLRQVGIALRGHSETKRIRRVGWAAAT